MFNLKYEIKLNDDGIPYVDLDKNQVDHPEHKFMAVEITRYLLVQLLEDNETHNELTDETAISVASAGMLLDQISDRLGKLIAGQNNALDELGLNVKDDE